MAAVSSREGTDTNMQVSTTVHVHHTSVLMAVKTNPFYV
jgi:hypothetical protein